MTGPRSLAVQERMEKVLAVLREDGGPMRCLDIATKAFGRRGQYNETMSALRHLVNAGLVEKLGSDALQHYVKVGGREVLVGPESGAVGFRAVQTKSKKSREAATARKRQAEIVARIEATGDLYGRAHVSS